jgi:hypothetical protein
MYCTNCNGSMIGDGITLTYHCENHPTPDLDQAPDSAPQYCTLNLDNIEDTHMSSTHTCTDECIAEALCNCTHSSNPPLVGPVAPTCTTCIALEDCIKEQIFHNNLLCHHDSSTYV